MWRQAQPDRKPANEDRGEQVDSNPYSAPEIANEEPAAFRRMRRFPAFHLGHLYVWILACLVLHPVNFYAIGHLFSPILGPMNDVATILFVTLNLLAYWALIISFRRCPCSFRRPQMRWDGSFLLFAIALQLARPRRREEDLGRLFVWGLGWWIWISIGFFQFKNVMENAG